MAIVKTILKAVARCFYRLFTENKRIEAMAKFKMIALISALFIGFLSLQGCSSMTAKDDMHNDDMMDSGDTMKDDDMMKDDSMKDDSM